MRVERIGDATLYLGDCRDILPTLGKVDAVVTDPPYGTKAYATDVNPVDVLVEVLGKGATSAVFGYPETLVSWCVAICRTPDEWVAWYPTNKATGRSKGLPKSSEHIAIFGPTPGSGSLFRPRSGDDTGRRISERRGLSSEMAREDDVWRDAAPGCGFNHRLRQHINEKPVSVMEKLVALCSIESATVMDPFMGSGTTGVACANLGRSFVGIEIDPAHFDTACRRIEEAYKQPRLFAEPEPKPVQESLL